MEELDVNTCLTKEDLFDLFKLQLKKDFEGAGLNGDFAEQLPKDFEGLKQLLQARLEPLIKSSFSQVSSLLYRVDISESQIRTYHKKEPALDFEEVISELIIKRVLQKVILKKTFSGK